MQNVSFICSPVRATNFPKHRYVPGQTSPASIVLVSDQHDPIVSETTTDSPVALNASGTSQVKNEKSSRFQGGMNSLEHSPQCAKVQRFVENVVETFPNRRHSAALRQLCIPQRFHAEFSIRNSRAGEGDHRRGNVDAKNFIAFGR